MTSEELMAKALEQSGLKADLDAHIAAAVVSLLQKAGRHKEALHIIEIAQKMRALNEKS